MLEHVDAWMIERFERVSHWTQRYFGLASPTWERLAIVLSLVCFVVKKIPADWGKTGALMLDAFVMLSLAVSFLGSLNRKPHAVFRNPAKLQSQSVRPILFMAAMAMIWYDWQYHSLWFQFLRVADYFGACDDLPPGESKVKSLIRAVRAFLTLAPVSAYSPNSNT